MEKMGFDSDMNKAKDIGDIVRSHILRANSFSVQCEKDTILFADLLNEIGNQKLNVSYNKIAEDIEGLFDIIHLLAQDINIINQYWVDYFTYIQNNKEE